MITMTKRFYTGSMDMANNFVNGIENPNMRTLADAIAIAKERVEEGKADCVFVVEVVKIVTRAPRPVIVESTR